MDKLDLIKIKISGKETLEKEYKWQARYWEKYSQIMYP